MLRMLAFKPATTETVTQKPKPPINKATQQQAPLKPVQTESPNIATEQPSKPDNTGHSWVDMIEIMKLESLTKELANNCLLESLDNEVCKLRLDASHQQLLTASRKSKLQQALQDYRGAALKLVIDLEQNAIATPAVQLAKAKEDKQQAAVDAINSDANIKALKEHFDARIMPGTIEPV
jgi:DNA polymerase III subunit gamma/tau